MPDVLMQGPGGKLEVRYFHAGAKAPIALILHGLPTMGCHMNQLLLYQLYQELITKGYTTIRLNFRGVGNSTGHFDDGIGELLDAAHVLDFVTDQSPGSVGTTIIGHSFGAWVGMQLMARRPDVTHFVALAPPVNVYSFDFLDASFFRTKGLCVSGAYDAVVTPEQIQGLVDHCNDETEVVQHTTIPEANHFFDLKSNEVIKAVLDYLPAY